MISEQVKDLACKIGYFFSDKYGDKAENIVRNLMISDIVVDDQNHVIITTSRPGLLIGKKGTTIEALTIYLGQPIKIVEAKENLLDYLLGFTLAVDY